MLVAAGTYHENIDFGGKTITVTSESGPEFTFIDGGHLAPVVSFISREERDAVLNGFTLQNGRAVVVMNQEFGNGGGIRVQQSSPTITNNIITNNEACGGRGIYIDSGSPLIQLNTIININGGETAIIKRNIIKGNNASHSNNVISSGGMAYGGTCSDKKGTEGNISADPLFINPTLGDYHLQRGSPSIDSGDSLTPYLLDKDFPESWMATVMESQLSIWEYMNFLRRLQ